jgi:hypothetical protein
MPPEKEKKSKLRRLLNANLAAVLLLGMLLLLSLALLGLLGSILKFIF